MSSPQHRIVSGTLSDGDQLAVGGTRIGYYQGVVRIDVAGTIVRVTPATANAAAFTVRCRAGVYPTLYGPGDGDRVGPPDEGPLVITGQGDYARDWPDDQAAGLRRAAAEERGTRAESAELAEGSR